MIGNKIIDGLRDAEDGNFADVTRPAVQVIDATLAALPESAESRRVKGVKRVKKRRLSSTIDDKQSDTN